MDDYATRFSDGVPPEACVTDMLRCMTLCSHGLGMLALLLLVSQEGGLYLTTADGVKVHLELIRTKNKFNPKKLNPMHLRNAMLNLRLHAKGTFMFVELQVHHADIKTMVTMRVPTVMKNFVRHAVLCSATHAVLCNSATLNAIQP